MLVPLYGFLRGDTLGLVILVQDSDKIRQVAANLQQAAAMRVAPVQNAQVWAHGRLLPPDLTVVEAGLSALDRVDVVPEPERT
jgi:Toluene-4-monooxygenase system protein B (TmoB)